VRTLSLRDCAQETSRLVPGPHLFLAVERSASLAAIERIFARLPDDTHEALYRDGAAVVRVQTEAEAQWLWAGLAATLDPRSPFNPQAILLRNGQIIGTMGMAEGDQHLHQARS